MPVGFLAAISKGSEGGELTEMGELGDAGAAGFTDDGRPVVSSSLMRRALQYGAVAGRTIAVHCEEPTLSRSGQMHEGEVSAELGFTGYPSVAESVMVGRDVALAAYEGRPVHVLHVSARESVEAVRRAQADGVAATAEVTPHHLVLTDEALRSLDPNVKMNPPLRSADDRQALIEALRDGTICAVATDHAPHARHEKDVPFEEAPFGVTGLETAFSALYTHLVEPGILPLATLLERMSAGPARVYGLEPPRIEPGAEANLVLLDTERVVARDGGRLPLALGELVAARAGAEGRRAHDRRRRPDRPRGMTGLLLEDGELFPGEPVGARRRCARRGRLRDRDDRLPGARHRPELRGPDPLLHGADGRQLRRRAGALGVGRRPRERPSSCARPAARRGRTGWPSTASSA